MLTGQYAHNNGVFSNRARLPRDAGARERAARRGSKRAGYNTSHVGKFLNGYRRSVQPTSARRPGGSAGALQEGPTYYDYVLVDEDGTHKSFGNASARLLHERAEPASPSARWDGCGERDAPFFLQLDHRAPHTESGLDSGGRCGGLALPAPGDEDLFAGTKVPRPPSFNETGRHPTSRS